MKKFTDTKIVLIRFSYSRDIYKVYKKVPKNREVRPPLSLMYIASSLEKLGCEIKIIDAEPELQPKKEVFKEVIELNPDFVGITSTTPEFSSIYGFIINLKKELEKVKVIVGGAHVSSIPIKDLKNFNKIDYFVIGEGELAVLDIIKGTKEKVIKKPLLKKLEDNVLPARHLVDYSKYKFPVPGKGMVQMDAIESSRGCLFHCVFCHQAKTTLRTRSVLSVISEIENSIKLYGTKFFMFFDDTFTTRKSFVTSFCSTIIKKGLHKGITFYVNARANTVDFEMLEYMKKANMTEISLGVETGNEEILKVMKKGLTKDQYKRVYKDLTKLGIQTRGSFVLGFPYENHKTIRETINFAKELDLMRINVNIMTPYPGTQIYDDAINSRGISFKDKNFKNFKRWGVACIETPSLTSKDLENYQKLFIMEFYTQWKVLRYHLKQLLKGNFSYYFYRPLIFALKNKVFWRKKYEK